jgi:hypothetical protein
MAGDGVGSADCGKQAAKNNPEKTKATKDNEIFFMKSLK